MKRVWIILLLLLPLAGYTQLTLYLENRIPVASERVTGIQISSSGRFLAFGDVRGGVYVWDIDARRLLHETREHRGQVPAVVFDSKERFLVTGSHDRRVIVWDLYSGEVQAVLKDFGSSIGSLALSPDDRLLAAAGDGRDICLWEFPIGTLKGKLKGHKKKVIAIGFNVNGDQLLTVGEDRQMIVWSVSKLQLMRKTSVEARTMKGSGIDLKTAAYSFDGQFAGVGIEEHMLAKGGQRMIFKYLLSFYDWQTGAEIATLEGNKSNLDFMAISPDKKYAITDNSTLRHHQLSFWNIENGVIEQNYPLDGKISAVAISQDGGWVAAGHEGPEVSRSHVNLWRLSGMAGYRRFAADEQIRSSGAGRFGSAIRLTTPEEPLIHFGERRRLAVLTFDSPGLEEDIARTTSYLLEGKLGNSPFLELVERNQIQGVLDELNYQQTGLTTSNAVEVGKHLNAEFVLLGSINKLGSLLIITAKLVNVETTRIEGTREVQCSNATIENISDMIALLAPAIAKY